MVKRRPLAHVDRKHPSRVGVASEVANSHTP